MFYDKKIKMEETVDLRNKPELKIVFKTDEFEVIDLSDPKNNGSYSFSSLNKVALNAEKANWWFSAFTVVVELFVGSGSAKIYNNKAYLNLNMDKRDLKIWLIDADFEKAKRATELLSKKSVFA
ncbi:hypothetical protein [Cellulophaga baltica]|uniref:hypothetical protein n=1 Tax=Cellulophaga baltica TaxID=76594 RepID=UPI0004254089|nr:hypothetical protein [Cellulophaga baltica]